jgi:vanillate O-demethylase ferredoxin subunit
MNLLNVRIEEISTLAIDVKLCRLEPVAGGELPAASPGAHIDVHVAPGIVRQYSLCGGPADRSSYVIAVKLEPESRGGSRHIHENFAAGATLWISAPRNHFPLDIQAGRHLLLAGGIGVTPLLSMARHLQAASGDFHLHYFARSVEHAAFDTVLRDAALSGRVTLHYGLDAAEVDERLDAILASPGDAEHLYVCGPRAFMDAALRRAQPDWPSARVHTEYFSAKLAQDDDAEPRSFHVRLARTGGEYEVGPDQSIVSALAQHEVYIDTSCEEGLCGTCIVDVLDGIPDHRDEVLSDDEKRAGTRIVPCVSRSKSKVIVLDF